MFILGVILYSIGEGITEAKTWLYAESELYPSSLEQDIYHIWRFFIETLGIVLMILYYESIGVFYGLVVVIFAISLYELVFSLILYGNPLYNKTSKWLGIPHPRGIVWLILLIVSYIYIISG